MSNAQDACLLCRLPDLRPVASRCRDSEAHSVVQCRSCGLIQLSPTPGEAEHDRFHDLDLQSQPILDTGNLDLVVARKTVDTARRVAFVRERLPPNASLLDIGSGYGVLLRELAREGFRVTGVEPSAARREVSRQITNAPVVSASVYGLPPTLGRFDAVLLIHVLEHLVDPVRALSSLAELVNQDGCVVVEVPNVADYLLEGSDEFRAFYWQQAHVSYFSPETLESVLRRAGFKRVEIQGVQRYGLENLMAWLTTGRPQLTEPSFHTMGPYRWLEDGYKQQLEADLRSDTLIAVGWF